MNTVDFALTVGPGVLLTATCIAAWRTVAALRRAARKVQEPLELRHTPAADDNAAGRDVDLLWACRRIGAEPLADPDASRRLINDLRDNAGEEDTP